MSTGIQIYEVVIADLIGIMLSAIVLMSNSWKFRQKDPESRILKGMFYCIILSCCADTLANLCDGRPGMINYLLVYAGNFWLYLSNVIFGPVWLYLVINHLNGKYTKVQIVLNMLLFFTGVTMLTVNFFFPIVFGIDENNVYYRGSYYIIYLVMEVILILDGLTEYILAKKRGGIFKFFPVWQFIIPLSTGILIQALVYGVSTIWPFIAISFCGVSISLQNESVYQDRLTGLYNRYYLDNVKKKLSNDRLRSKDNSNVTVMMLDMNGFKSINDVYGHQVGDDALVSMAEILRSTVGVLGSVIRFAGDEFLILLNTNEDEQAGKCIASIAGATEEFNRSSDKPYKLSYALGYCGLDLRKQTVDELLNEVDRRMYLEKEKFYKENSGRNRRKTDR